MDLFLSFLISHHIERPRAAAGGLSLAMPEIAPGAVPDLIDLAATDVADDLRSGVSYGTLAREWRCKWWGPQLWWKQ